MFFLVIGVGIAGHHAEMEVNVQHVIDVPVIQGGLEITVKSVRVHVCMVTEQTNNIIAI